MIREVMSFIGASLTARPFYVKREKRIASGLTGFRPDSSVIHTGACEATTMKKATGTWYTEKGITEKPSSVSGHVDLYRAGKFIATVKAS